MSKYEQYLKKDAARRRRTLDVQVRMCVAVVVLGMILGQIIRIYVG